MPNILARLTKATRDRRSSSSSTLPEAEDDSASFEQDESPTPRSPIRRPIVDTATASAFNPRLTVTDSNSDSPRSLNSTEGNSPRLNDNSYDDLPTPIGDQRQHSKEYYEPISANPSGVNTAEASVDADAAAGAEMPERGLTFDHLDSTGSHSPSATSITSVEGTDDANHDIKKKSHSKFRSGSLTDSLIPSKISKRRGSNASHRSNGIVAALVGSGLSLAGGHSHGGTHDLMSSAKSTVSAQSAPLPDRAEVIPTARSPYLTKQAQSETGSIDEDYSDEDGEGVFGDGATGMTGTTDATGDGGSEGGHSLPVTGFAVASNRRNADFHHLFPTVDAGDYLIEDYGCALSKDILVQGRIYVSENHICFHANIFGWVTDVVIPFSEIISIEKKMTALVIPNAIGISTMHAKHTFASFISRDTTYDVMHNIWRLSHPNATDAAAAAASSSQSADTPAEKTAGGTGAGGGGKGHAPTQCACGKKGEHYPETAFEGTLPSSPEKIFNLMFTSGWFKTFLVENQKLRDLESSDWKPETEGSNLLERTMSYIKPLNGSIGPKQTKCHIQDITDHQDFDDYVSMITTTRTPDVPSGGVFSVKTRTCLTWAGANSTKIVVTTVVEWTGKSWVKGIIEKSCIEGQKSYHDDLIKAMKVYIKEHATEFAGEGGVEEADDEVDTTASADGKLTAAEEYAANTRRQRQNEDMSALSWSIDAVVSGVKTIGGGLWGVVESLGDLIRDIPINKETALIGLIFILLLFNLWTYFFLRSTGSTSTPHRTKRHRLQQTYEADDVAEAMRLLLGEHHRSAGPRETTAVAVRTPLEEANDLLVVLADVEAQLVRIKADVASFKGPLAPAALDKQD